MTSVASSVGTSHPWRKTIPVDDSEFFLVGKTVPSTSSSVEQPESTSLSIEEHSDSSSAMYEDLFQIAGADGFHARHIRIARCSRLSLGLCGLLGCSFGLGLRLCLRLSLGFRLCFCCRGGWLEWAILPGARSCPFVSSTLDCLCVRKDSVFSDGSGSQESSWND